MKNNNQRIIKFRAWDDWVKTMLYFDKVGFNLSSNQLVIGKCMDGQIPTTNLMQYTGLKDKDDKEIYEGDILDTGHRRYKVWYRDGRFGAHSHGLYLMLGQLKCEIIGNIYENTDLV